MAKAGKAPAKAAPSRALPTVKKLKKLKVEKRTSQGGKHFPKNKHARRRWKRYRGQGRG